MRVKAVISYDGGFFQGFQKQTRTNKTITTAIERALKSLHIDSPIIGSGRTDAGVHATGQVISFDLPEFWTDTQKLQQELNRKLKHISVKHISQTSELFHARFHAKRRIYRYVFKEKKPSIFEENHISYYSSFDSKRLSEALKYFEGEHDFCFFHKQGSEVHTTVRTIYKAHYRVFGDYHIIYFEANGFLRSQVRMMVEVAMRCADAQITVRQLQEQIDSKKRYITALAPAQGLYLARVIY